MNALIQAFANDGKVIALMVLVVLDFVLGVSSSVYKGTFRLPWISDFLRQDILGKLVPYFALWAAVHLSGDIEIPGIDFGLLENGAFVLIAGAIVGSVLNSLRDFGLAQLPDAVAGDEDKPPSPAPPPPPA